MMRPDLETGVSGLLGPKWTKQIRSRWSPFGCKRKVSGARINEVWLYIRFFPAQWGLCVFLCMCVCVAACTWCFFAEKDTPPSLISCRNLWELFYSVAVLRKLTEVNRRNWWKLLLTFSKSWRFLRSFSVVRTSEASSAIWSTKPGVWRNTCNTLFKKQVLPTTQR